MEKQKRIWIFTYVLYGFIALLFFLYLLFPGQVVKDYLIAEASKKHLPTAFT